jgi:hypothetical protein
MKLIIQSKAEYEAAMETIREMMNRGEENLTEAERTSFFRIAVAIERYEDYFIDKSSSSPYSC